jgi:hypothetical protein
MPLDAASPVDHNQPVSPLLERRLAAEYTETNQNFRTLIDVRFKLLALIPTLGGIAIYLLSVFGLSADAAALQQPERLWLTLLIATLGFGATLGITFYDQRNSELYDALIHRAKYIERRLSLPRSEGARNETLYGGQFNERPPRTKAFLALTDVKYGHDNGLALIYGVVLGAWWFPGAFSALSLIGSPRDYSIPVAGFLSLVVAAGFVYELVRQDTLNRAEWDKASKPPTETSHGAA